MIIQSSRLRTTLDLKKLVRHVFHGPANEDILTLMGTPDDLAAMRDDAAAAGKKFAIRHFKIAPEMATTIQQAAEVMKNLAGEFGFAAERAVVIQHKKQKAGRQGYDTHWHVLAPEWDPVRRRVLDSHWMRPRQEKIARQAEIAFGHAVVVGRWNAAVARTLAREGKAAEAAEIEKLAARPRPGAAYSSRRHQTAARGDVDIAQARLAVAAAWARSDNGEDFERTLAKIGLSLRAGDKDGIWLVEAARQGQGPVMVGALHRLLRQRKNLVAARLRQTAATPPIIPRRPVIEPPRRTIRVPQEPKSAAFWSRARIIRIVLPEADREMRRRRWIAWCLSQAYDTGWLPLTVAARIERVQWDEKTDAVFITLKTGTVLADRGDRIDVVGDADDIAIAELVACVQRRGWTQVEVYGDEAFRRDATRALREAGIAVDLPPIPKVEMLPLPPRSDIAEGMKAREQPIQRGPR
jgi:hypothetical protein